MPSSVTHDARFEVPSAHSFAYYHLPIIPAIRREWAAITGWVPRIAYLSSMTNKVDVHRVTPLWRNQRQQRLVRIIGALAQAKQAEPLRDSPYMGINRKRWSAEGE